MSSKIIIEYGTFAKFNGTKQKNNKHMTTAILDCTDEAKNHPSEWPIPKWTEQTLCPCMELQFKDRANESHHRKETAVADRGCVRGTDLVFTIERAPCFSCLRILIAEWNTVQFSIFVNITFFLKVGILSSCLLISFFLIFQFINYSMTYKPFKMYRNTLGVHKTWSEIIDFKHFSYMHNSLTKDRFTTHLRTYFGDI